MIDATFIFTITLYNRYTDKSSGRSVIHFKRTVLKNCYFGTETVKQINGNTLSQANNYICRIPQNDAYIDIYNGEEDRFTLKPGDIIVKGEVEEEIQDVQGERVSDLLQKYNGTSFTVRAVSDNTLLADSRHYRASGV